MRNINVPSESFLQNRQNCAKAIQELFWCMKEITEGESGDNEKIGQLQKEIYSLKQQVGNLGGDVTYECPDTATGKNFGTLMNNNGTVKRTEDVTASRMGPGILAKNKVTLNLNGHNLSIPVSGSLAAIQARGTQEVTIKGAGTIDAGAGICIMCNSKNAVINLTGSTTNYKTERPNAELIYCYLGTINISGGIFRNGGSHYLLNCYDANYKNGTAQIIVTGGKFYDFDPGNNKAEGENTSFLAEGYISVPSTVVEDGVDHTVYTVKKG